MVAGGAESPICRHRHRRASPPAGRCRPASTTRPTKASRPYDKDRDGFVMGEGAGVVVLEELRARQGARRQDLCRGDRLRHVGRRLSHHRAGRGRRRRVPLHEGGAEARRHLRRATSTTSTRTAPRRRSATRSSSARWSGWSAMPPASISMSSTKSSIGHLLGAAGAVEAIFSILAIRDSIAPPTLNLDNPSVETPIDLVPHQATQARDRRRAVQFVRLRRHQRLADLPPRGMIDG